METNTELLKDSGEAIVQSESAEGTAASLNNGEQPERTEKKSSGKKKPPQKKKAAKAPDDSASISEHSEPNEAVIPESIPESVSESSVISEATESKTAKTSTAKPARKKKPAKESTEKQVADASVDAPKSAESTPAASEPAEAPEAETVPAEPAKKSAKPSKRSSQKKEAPTEAAAEPISTPAAPAEADSEPAAEAPAPEAQTEEAPADDTAEKKAEKKPSRSRSRRSAKEKQKVEAKDDAVSEKIEPDAPAAPLDADPAPVNAESIIEVIAEEKTEEASETEIPSEPAPQLQPEKPSVTVDVSGTPPDTFVFYSPSQLAAMEEERKKEAEKKETVVSEEPEAAPTAVAAELPAAPEAEKDTAEKPAVPQTEARRSESRRRGDPHEREVMDKERVYALIYEVITEAVALERRILIEETMKRIPLTDEERADNHPTSLSNRVRSVIGSVLAEQIALSKIVAAGRKLTLPTSEQEPAVDTTVEPSEKETIADESEKPEVTVDIEIELVKEPTEEEAPAEIAVPIEVEIEAPMPIAEETAETAPVDEPVLREPSAIAESSTREPSVRRVRQSRGERRPADQQRSTQTAVLITEDEIERTIMNALRRNSATRNDLLAVLKRTYVEPNRFSREDENRIYAVADSALQKLVARGTLQNNDGRYLQKPSQRVLNPGRAPGANFTGNVETRFITELNRQSGDFFEQFAARLLEKYFEMSDIHIDASYVVGGSDDNGIDIMLETTDWLGYKERVFVQAKKRATQPVTLKEVREFYGALCAEEGTRGIFITTSSFCMEASKMIGKIRNLIAIDKRKLFDLAEHCEVGLVRDEDGRLLLDENLFLDYDV